MCIILQKNPADHITDHLPFRSTRKQWIRERRRARFSERKGAEKAIFSGNCHHKCVWDHQAAGSNPVTRTISSVRKKFSLRTLAFIFIPLASPLQSGSICCIIALRQNEPKTRKLRCFGCTTVKGEYECSER